MPNSVGEDARRKSASPLFNVCQPASQLRSSAVSLGDVSGSLADDGQKAARDLLAMLIMPTGNSNLLVTWFFRVFRDHGPRGNLRLLTVGLLQLFDQLRLRLKTRIEWLFDRPGRFRDSILGLGK